MTDFEVPMDLKIIYLRRRVEEFPALEAELDQGSFELAKKIGHQVKGNAATFDFPVLTDMGIELEEAAKTQDQAAAKKISLEMKETAESLLKALTL
jgi:HPt (histidine-containing phosphotransfer) domain-containing protein